MITKNNMFIIFLSILVFFHLGLLFAKQNIDPKCGPQSLYVICNKMGISVTLDELYILTKYNNKNGTNMLNLYNAAITKGLNVIPLNLSINDYCQSDSYGIAHVDGNHFLVVLGCSSDSVIVQDYPEKPYYLSKYDFLERWDGQALIFPKENKSALRTENLKDSSKNDKPSISFDYKLYDFGQVNAADSLEHKFKFRNIGTDSLRIIDIRSSCSCTAAILSDYVIPPGGNGEIGVTFNTKGISNGEVRESVFLRSNDPNEPLMKITVIANILNVTKAIPSKIWIDEVKVNKEIQREVLVRDNGQGNLIVKDITVPEGVSAKILMPKTINDNLVIPINLIINSGNKVGIFEKKVIIYTNDSQKPKIEIPLSGLVLAEAKVLPERIFYDSVKPNSSVVHEAIISSSFEEKYEIYMVTSTSKYISTKVIPIENNKKYKLLVTIKAPDRQIVIRDKIQIFFDDSKQHVLDVPLYVRVK